MLVTLITALSIASLVVQCLPCKEELVDYGQLLRVAHTPEQVCSEEGLKNRPATPQRYTKRVGYFLGHHNEVTYGPGLHLSRFISSYRAQPVPDNAAIDVIPSRT